MHFQEIRMKRFWASHEVLQCQCLLPYQFSLRVPAIGLGSTATCYKYWRANGCQGTVKQKLWWGSMATRPGEKVSTKTKATMNKWITELIQQHVYFDLPVQCHSKINK